MASGRDVWVHTLHCMDAFARERIGEDWEDLVVGFAVLCHDLGKPLTTHIAEDGGSARPCMNQEAKNQLALLSRMTNQVDLIEQVVPLVKRHLTPRIFYKDQASEGAIRRLAQKVKRIDRTCSGCRSRYCRPPTKKGCFPEGPWLLARAEELKVKDSEPHPIVLGRHLIDRDSIPEPALGPF